MAAAIGRTRAAIAGGSGGGYSGGGGNAYGYGGGYYDASTGATSYGADVPNMEASANSPLAVMKAANDKAAADHAQAEARYC